MYSRCGSSMCNRAPAAIPPSPAAPSAARLMRHLLMTAKRLTEDEPISLISVAVDIA